MIWFLGPVGVLLAQATEQAQGLLLVDELRNYVARKPFQTEVQACP